MSTNDLQFGLKTENFIVFTNGEVKSAFTDGSFSWDVRFIPTEGSLKSFKEGVRAFLESLDSKTNSAFTGRVIREFELKKKDKLVFAESELIINDELIRFTDNGLKLDKHMFAKRLLDAGWEII